MLSLDRSETWYALYEKELEHSILSAEYDIDHNNIADSVADYEDGSDLASRRLDRTSYYCSLNEIRAQSGRSRLDPHLWFCYQTPED